MSVYVTLPNAIQKFSTVYAQTGNRKKRIHKDTFKDVSNLSNAACNNYIWGAVSFNLVHRINSSEFKVSDSLIQLQKAHQRYRAHLHDVFLSNPTFMAIIKRFGGKVPTHRKLSKFLRVDLGLGVAASASTLNSYYQTISWLEKLNMDDFDLGEISMREAAKDNSKNNKQDSGSKNENPHQEEKRKTLEEELKDFDDGDEEPDVNSKQSSGGSPKPDPRHALPNWVRAELEGIEGRIAYLKGLIVKYEAKLPSLKEELWDLQRRQFELESGQY